MGVHFTLFAADNVPVGSRIETSWEALSTMLCTDPPAPRETPKRALGLWSPATYKGEHRARANVELVHALGYDVDVEPVPIEAELRTALAGQACLFHSSSSATPAAPRWRLLLRLSRPVTAAEYDVLWPTVAAALPFAVGKEAKDPSRGWYLPRVPAEGEFVAGVLEGAPVDVDGVLANVPESLTAPSVSLERNHVHDTRTLEVSTPHADARRTAMAAALGAAWPARGRHEAQLALAGALRGEGFTESEALEFLCAVCRAAGNEDRPKRAATVRHTYAKPDGSALTGWTRLKAHVDPVVVDAARGALGRDAAWTEDVNRRLAAVAAAHSADGAVVLPTATTLAIGPITFEHGGYDAPLPPLRYQVADLIGRGDVVMCVAHGNSLKTWVAISLAHAVASGRPWLGRFPTEQGRAAFVDFESGRYEILRRMKLLGVRDADVGDRLLRASFPPAAFTDPETWIALAGHGLEFVGVDSYNAAAPEVDENDARAALMLQNAARFAEHTACTVLFVHHARKGTGGDRRESVRGSTALFAACDRIFDFTEPEKHEGGLVTSTMRSLKDGAGRTPPDVQVELSDQGLRYVEQKPETKKEEKSDKREIVLEILKSNAAGVLKSEIVDILGEMKRANKYELLAQLSLSGVTVEFRSENKTYVMLNPANAQER